MERVSDEWGKGGVLLLPCHLEGNCCSVRREVLLRPMVKDAIDEDEEEEEDDDDDDDDDDVVEGVDGGGEEEEEDEVVEEEEDDDDDVFVLSTPLLSLSWLPFASNSCSSLVVVVVVEVVGPWPVLSPCPCP